ncbi:MAG: NAD(P)/FAD-dependent oxidoreductase [Armatimonadetes bacterium]|nr:NAD(P)/FAD-dependent oxidoreductase [Armatimonadota bacterium]
MEIDYDLLLVATGRRASVDGLNLEAAGVRLDERGYVLTDRRLRTTAPDIWAAGDVHGGYQFTHVAEHEAKHILPQALFRLPVSPSYRVVPWCTFTDPELARVGLNEQEARERGIDYRVWRFAVDRTDRAITEGEDEGFYKILTDRKGRIIGTTIVGPQAGELIHEFILAMERRLKPSHISTAIHVYPTLALGARRAADNYTLQHLVPEWVMNLARRFFGYDTSRSPGKLVTGVGSAP